MSQTSLLCDLQPDFAEEATVALPVMPYGEVGSTYVVLARQEGSLALGKFACTLRFTVKEIDPSTGVARPAVCLSVVTFQTKHRSCVAVCVASASGLHCIVLAR